MPPSRTRLLTRRTVATSSLLGVGLIASAATAPVALATGDEEQPASSVADDGSTGSSPVLNTTTTPTLVDGPAVTPFFGTGKQATVTVGPAAGTAPGDLDLSGAELDLVATGTSGPVVASCTTTPSGSCSFFNQSGYDVYEVPPPATTASSRPVPAGTYDVLEATAVAGLARVPGVLGTVQLTYGWFTSASNTVPAASLFRTTVKATVSTADTPPQPVPAATYSLDGAAYPRLSGSPVDPSTALPRAGTSNADGRITYSGWFAPGNYTLTAQGATTPAKTFAIAAQVGRPPADVLVDLTVGATGTAIGTASTGDTSPPAAPTTVAPTTAGPTAAPTTASPPRTHPAPAAVAPTAPTTSAAPAPSPAALQPGNALPQVDRDAADGVRPVALPAVAPALETRSQSFPYGSVLAFGGPFVAAVIAAVVLILRRRRARYEYDA